MARFTIVSQLLAVPLPNVLGETDTAAEAHKMAQGFTKAGKLNVRIGDAQTQSYYDAADFAAEHKLR